MSLKLSGLGESRSFRCLWALEEAGVDYQYLAIEFGSDQPGGSKDIAYLAKNPQGKLPTLEHDGFILTESAAIINYIDSLTEQTFIPTKAKARAKYDELSFFILAEMEQGLWTTGKHKFALPEEHRVADILPTARFEFAKAVKAFDKLFTAGDYVLGDSFTFADILLAHTINWANKFEFEVPKHFTDYHARMYARPAVQRAKELLK
jgi:glutathione S-transferase